MKELIGRPYVGKPLIGKSKAPVATDPVLASRDRLKSTAITALRRYIPAPYSGRVCIFLPNMAWQRSDAAPHQWLRIALHADFFSSPGIASVPGFWRNRMHRHRSALSPSKPKAD